jgi:hypothetical protein
MPGAKISATGRFAFSALSARVYGDLESSQAVSISRETNPVPDGTPMVPSESQNIGPKLSKSSINNPLQVNKPVASGRRKKPAMRGSVPDVVTCLAYTPLGGFRGDLTMIVQC